MLPVHLEEEGWEFVPLVILCTTNMEKKCCLWPHTHILGFFGQHPIKSVSNTPVL